MEPDEVALLNAILLEPRDRVRRVAYADWLEERGQTERSQYVRDLLTRDEDPFFGLYPAEWRDRLPRLRANLAPDWITLIDGADLIGPDIIGDWGHRASIDVLWAIAGERNVALLDGLQLMSPFGMHGFFYRARCTQQRYPGVYDLGSISDEAAGLLAALGQRIVGDGLRPLVALSHPSDLLRAFCQRHAESGWRWERVGTDVEWHRITNDWSILCGGS